MLFDAEPIRNLLLRPIHNGPLSHLLLALAAVFLSFQTVRILGSDPSVLPVQFVIFIFCSTLFQYALHALGLRIFTLLKSPLGTKRTPQEWLLLCVAGITFLLGGICFFLLDFRQMIYAVVLALASLAYTFPILPFGGLRRFKNHFVYKLIVLSAVWTLATVLIPAAFLKNYNTGILLWLIAFRFVYFLAICIPFEIRDVDCDRELGVPKSISEMGNIRKGYPASYVCLAVNVVMLIPALLFSVSGYVLAGLLISVGLGAWFVRLSSRNPEMPLYYFLLDSSLIFQSMLVAIGTHLD